MINSLQKVIVIFCLFLSATSSSKQLNESRYVMINGIEQWITYRGNSDKPILFIIHGGPGSAMSPYAAALYKEWEADFIIAQWDQRGAGRTYGKNGPAELTPEYLKANPLSIEQMAADGIAVTEYLTKQLSKSKVILFGTSWGSALGVQLASRRPDLYYAYIGHSQIVNPNVDNPKAYDHVRQLAVAANDQESITKLDQVGRPPYASASDMGKWIRVIKKYERAATTAPGLPAIISPEYENPTDEAASYTGDDYSFANYAGDAKMGLKSIAAGLDYFKNNSKFGIPIYLIQGEQDLLTPKSSTRPYFDKIDAPTKEYLLLTTSGHNLDELMFKAKREICNRIAALIEE